MTKKQKAIIFLNGSDFSFYAQGGTQVLKGVFPPEAVKNLEVVNRSLLTQTLQTFFKTNAIAPSTVTLVIGDKLLFLKEVNHVPMSPLQQAVPESIQPAQSLGGHSGQTQVLAKSEPGQNEDTKHGKKLVISPVELAARKEKETFETQKFLDNVPIENIVHKIIPIESGIRIIVTNADFIESLQQVMFLLGSIIEIAIPVTAYKNKEEFQGELTVQKAQQLLLKQEDTKQYNFLEIPNIKTTHTADGTIHHEKIERTRNVRLYAMVGIFTLLIIVTVVMFMLMMKENEKSAKPAVSLAIPPLVSSTPGVTASPIATDSASFSQSTKIQLLSSTSSQDNVTFLTTDLQGLGIRQITTVQNIATSGARITFLNVIPQTARDQLITILKKYYPTVIVSESNILSFDAIISF